MKLKYLGTAAAEGIPAIFCECEVCKKAMELGGRNIRTRSQAIIDDGLLIDFPADTYMHFLKYKIPMTKIKHCLITHAHADHLYPEDIFMRKKGFAHLESGEPVLNFYAWTAGYKAINKIITSCNVNEANAHLIKPGDVFDIDGYKITVLEASHAANTSPVVYIIEKDGRSVFYSNDTSDYPEKSWKILKKYGKPISLISLDCTEANSPVKYIGHMGVERCIEIREKLKNVGVADENTIFVLHHFSHNGGDVLYDDFKKIADEYGFLVSYDGMEIEF